MLKAKNTFLLWIDAVDSKGNSLGLVYAKKLELDAEKFGCKKNGCNIQDRWSYGNIE